MKLTSAVNLAISNVLKEGLTDIFPEPFETNLLKNNGFQKIVKHEVIRAISGGSLDSLKMLPIEHVILPKTSAFDFRRCALIHPMDTLKFLTLVLLFAEEIEINRPAKATKFVFSYRFSPRKGNIFNPEYNYTSFNKHVSKKLKNKKTNLLVSCDIANFYDRINLHRLESILLSLNLDKNQVKLLNQLLLFWANRDSYGLPVGSNASRILAEASLLEVDRYLISIKADFCRFVDDYRLFAPDAHTAHQWMMLLIERLWLEGLTINKSKTKIEDVSDCHDISDQTKLENTEDQIEKFDNSNQEHEQKGTFRIIAGYGGVIPTKFRKPSDAEINRLKNTDVSGLLKKIKTLRIIASEDVINFVRAALYRKEYKRFLELPLVIEKYLQTAPYVIDLLIKHKDDIPEDIRLVISDKLSRWLTTKKQLPEYIALAIIKLLGAEGFQNKDVLFDYFRTLKRNAGAYIGRALLDALEGIISRGDVIEIRNYFTRADSWEKRQIVHIVNRHLYEDEKRPWLKGAKLSESNDLFLVEMINPTNGGVKKKRKKKKSMD